MIGFGLEPMFTSSDMKQITDRMEKEMNDLILVHLTKVAERAIEIVRLKAKSQGGYNDDTGNLRSGTGFIIHKDGRIVHKDFKASSRGSDKQTGLNTGLQVALSELRGSGWGIFMVSGMEYASWVQAKGYDVLGGATVGLDQALQQAFNEIGEIE